LQKPRPSPFIGAWLNLLLLLPRPPSVGLQEFQPVLRVADDLSQNNFNTRVVGVAQCPLLSEAVGTMIIVALVGSHLGMWWRCRRD
jgi:hypothetical protein